MAFTGDHPISDVVLFNVSGSSPLLVQSESINVAQQPGMPAMGMYSGSWGKSSRFVSVDDNGFVNVNATFGGVQQVTGTVAIVGGVGGGTVSGTVHIDRGDSAALPLFVTGTLATYEAPATSASGTFYAASVTVLTVAPANLNRRQLMVHNNSSKVMYLKLGSACSFTDFSFKIFADDSWKTDIRYTGIVTAIWPSGSTSGALVTEIVT